MSTTTSNLGLFKYDTTLDAEVPFSIDDALNQNWNKIDSSVVKKSGDTMTGDLTIDTDTNTPHILLQSNIFDYTTTVAPTNAISVGSIGIRDKNENNVGLLQTIQSTSNDIETRLYAFRNVNGTSYSGMFRVGINSNGVASCTFPNTTCVDGQWVSLNQKIISSSTSLVGSSDLSYTVNVPNDGHYYEIIVEGQVRSNNTKNYWGSLQVNTSFGGYMIAQAKSETDTVNDGMSCVTIPLGTNRNLQVVRQNSSTNFQCACLQLTIKAYRRIGTNS